MEDGEGHPNPQKRLMATPNACEYVQDAREDTKYDNDKDASY